MKKILLFTLFLSFSLLGMAQIGLPLGFEEDPASYDFLGFEGADSAIEANPDMNGNPSGNVMRTTKTEGAQFFAGTLVNLDEAIDFSNSGIVNIDVWSPKANIPVRVRFENADNTAGMELDRNISTANGWETLEYDFTSLIDQNADYVRVVVFFEFIVDLAGDGTTYYYDNVAIGTPPMNPIALPLDFEQNPEDYDFMGFEGADSQIEANPDMNGNTSANVMRSTKTEGAQFFAGTLVNLNEPIDFSSTGTIEIDMWSPKADIPVRVRIENADNSVGMEVDQTISTANAWQTMEFDFSGFIDPNANYVRVVVFFEFVVDLPGDGSTYYYDNVKLGTPPMTTIGLPLDFEQDPAAYDFLGFEGADSAIEPNPDMNGNTSGNVMRTTKTEGAQFFAGTLVNLDEAIDFSSTSTLSIDLWSPKADIPVRVRLENADNSVGAELDMNVTTASSWQTIEYDFTGLVDPNVDYVRVIVFCEFVVDLPGDGSTYYFDNIALGTPPMGDIGLPLDFEQDPASYDFLGFEGADSAIEPNPDMNGNSSANVMRSIKTEGAQFFAGTLVNLDQAIDFSTTNVISVDVWSPKANIPVRLRLENADNSVGMELDQTITMSSTWETLSFDFTGMVDPNADYVRVVVFFEFVVDLAGDGSTYYYDNVITGFPTSVTELPTIDLTVAPNPTVDYWDLSTNSETIQSIELFDYTGNRIFMARPNSTSLNIPARDLETGIYVARVTTAQGMQTIRLVKQ